MKRVKRGHRDQRENHYLHLARKANAGAAVNTASSSSSYNQSSFLLVDLKIPSNWSMVPDKEENISFIHVENFEANNRRAVTEVSIVLKNGKVDSCSVQAHGSTVRLNLEELGVSKNVVCWSLHEGISQILLFVENSTLCEGYRLLSEEKVVTLIPHHLQYIRDLTKPENIEAEKRAYSGKCLVLATPGRKGLTRCGNCSFRKKKTLRERRERMIDQQCIQSAIKDT